MIIPAIVVPCFNRPRSLARLLDSLNTAIYPTDSISLIISIDGGGVDEVRIIADSFHWHHGQKLIIKHSVNLGLKNHIIYCGNLSEKYGAIVVLEDDSFVSPLFYQYAVSSCNYYNEDDNICGIALYSYRMNEIADCAPFVPYDNGYDAFFMQVPCSWGQVWTYEQWKPFKQFVELGLNDLSSLKIPLEVKTWPGSSWKRLMFAYMCIHNKFFVYPYRSFTTNFGDSGTHLAYNSTAWQSELCIIEKSQFRFQKLSKSALIYDAWMEITPTFLVNRGVKIQDDTCIDLYGTKELNFFNDCQFWLTRKKSSNFIRRYGLFSFPIENNIILSFPGTDISYSCYNTLSTKIQVHDLILGSRFSAFSFSTGKQRVLKSKAYQLGSHLLGVFQKLK